MKLIIHNVGVAPCGLPAFYFSENNRSDTVLIPEKVRTVENIKYNIDDPIICDGCGNQLTFINATGTGY